MIKYLLSALLMVSVLVISGCTSPVIIPSNNSNNKTENQSVFTVELCGNKRIDAGEQCDPPGQRGCPRNELCQNNCRCPSVTVCGNSKVEASEECDPPGSKTCPENKQCQTDCACSKTQPCDPDKLPVFNDYTVQLEHIQETPCTGESYGDAEDGPRLDFCFDNNKFKEDKTKGLTFLEPGKTYNVLFIQNIFAAKYPVYRGHLKSFATGGQLEDLDKQCENIDEQGLQIKRKELGVFWTTPTTPGIYKLKIDATTYHIHCVGGEEEVRQTPVEETFVVCEF